ncbi:MAG: SAM-dependent methyltransferase [Bacteroidales bacterium]|nr:SAM-dependent methyltransferase [Bacteroidales bacterium]
MDTRQYIAEHLHDDVHDLALKTTDARVDKALALRQIEARQLLRKKVPSWSDNDELLFPPHLSVEQCSSETTAQYKASLLKGSSFADLTGGLGVDCHFISQGFSKVDYVEQNADLCALAEHNYKVLGDTIRVHNASAEDYLQQCDCLDAMFIDPARRDTHGHKVVSIADCSPNIVEIQDLMLGKARQVMVKLSPMLDISQALRELHHVKEVHVVAVENECKELLFLLERDYTDKPSFVCVNLNTTQDAVCFTEDQERESQAVLAHEVQSYLYEPNAAVMKGGCYRWISEHYDVLKLHRNSHLYTANKLVADFPGRIFVVRGWAPYGKKVRQTLLSDLSKASIATRNFPLSVAELRKALKIGDGDEDYLFATTLAPEQKILILTAKV